MADERQQLFHHVYPVPEHCGVQMRPLGNMSLHVLRYECVRCLKKIEVEATFRDAAEDKLDPETREAIDQTA